jgi:MFS family permease
MNHAVNDGSIYLLSSLFPVVLAIFDLSVFQVGVLVGVGYLVSVIGQPIVGRYSEEVHPEKLLAVGIAIIAASVVTFILSTGFYSLLGSVILLRIGSCFYHPVGVSAVSKTYARRNLDRAMGIQSAFGDFGILIVFLLAAPVYLTLGWKATFILFAAVDVVDIAITLAFFKSPKATTLSQHEAPNQGIGHRIPLFFLLVSFVSGACFAIVLNYTNILVESESGTGVFLANMAVSGWIALACLGAISTGKWPGAKRRAMFLSLIFLLSAMTLMILAYNSSNLALTIPLLLINGFTVSATYPLTYSELSDYLGEESETHGRYFGAIFSAQTIGGSALGVVSGYLSTVYGLPSAFYIAGLLMLIGSGISLSWTHERSS